MPDWGELAASFIVVPKDIGYGDTGCVVSQLSGEWLSS